MLLPGIDNTKTYGYSRVPKTKTGAKRERLSREAWLQQALDVLSREGEGKFRIDAVCAALGVTKGSFYWHFHDRSDFLDAIFAFWVEAYNARVPETTEQHGGDAAQRLRYLFNLVTSENLGRYDVAFDAWSSHEPGMAERVKGVYALRYRYVRSLFRELGYRGIQLEVRTTAFLSFLKSESQVTGKKNLRRNPRRLDAEVAFFTTPTPGPDW